MHLYSNVFFGPCNRNKIKCQPNEAFFWRNNEQMRKSSCCIIKSDFRLPSSGRFRLFLKNISSPSGIHTESYLASNVPVSNHLVNLKPVNWQLSARNRYFEYCLLFRLENKFYDYSSGSSSSFSFVQNFYQNFWTSQADREYVWKVPLTAPTILRGNRPLAIVFRKIVWLSICATA